jgi:hypothetical protein
VSGEADDVALLDAVRGGSERAFNLLVDRHQQAVRLFLRGVTGTRSRRAYALTA